MPDHIHLLLTPAQEVSIEKAMQFIKGNFSFHLRSAFDAFGSASHNTGMPVYSALLDPVHPAIFESDR